jgi:hypothetical protein
MASHLPINTAPRDGTLIRFWCRSEAAPIIGYSPRSISRTGYRVHVWCKSCRHAKDADLAALIDAGPRRYAVGADEMALQQLRLAADRIHRGPLAHEAAGNRDLLIKPRPKPRAAVLEAGGDVPLPLPRVTDGAVANRLPSHYQLGWGSRAVAVSF